MSKTLHQQTSEATEMTKHSTSIVISCSQVTRLICIFQCNSNNSTRIWPLLGWTNQKHLFQGYLSLSIYIYIKQRCTPTWAFNQLQWSGYHACNLYKDIVIEEFTPIQCLELAKKINAQINLPIIFLIQKYFFHDKYTWNINYLE